MCGRYTFTTPAPTAEKRFDAGFADPAPTTYNAAPSQQLPIITNHDPGRIHLLNWGLVPAWTKDLRQAPKPINARAETLPEKPSFRQLLQRRRCLVLADSFYEWQQLAGRKTPYRILREDEQPFAFAGLWDEWADRSTGEVVPTFTIITTEPNELMAKLHNRMPVILPNRAAELAWLDDNTSAADHQALLRPLPDGVLKAYAVTTRVNSPAHNDPSVLEPAAA
ncbi:SOS response-associated peptidase [Hymenobacter busanensis]|uniref:Abasic site processing protein n=1 Tax=Hymenobacter busanensis TaxID=2607656 RepID=A0A7L4ZZ42_9BACT|nr:SOS response-associated peptidase [Hymenobacter busanensis]KAA9333112.1 SOS response-associated peptidase [Hymenobacter busanensis]QHJ08213.1 SOS response-associated peptidase [Hymenobacter busanensis]